jgi:hypothetical protein
MNEENELRAKSRITYWLLSDAKLDFCAMHERQVIGPI